MSRSGSELSNFTDSSCSVDIHSAVPSLHDLHWGHVAELWVYPVKGVRGRRVASALLVETGLQYDREWAVVAGHPPGPMEVLSMNKAPNLGTACAFVDESRGVLVVTAPGKHTLSVPLSRTTFAAETLPVTLFGMDGVARDEGDEAADWFTELVGRPVRLARIAVNRRPEHSPRHVGTNVPTDAIKFHDYGTLHLICDSGVAWLAENVSDGSPVTTEQFRANIVVSGIPFPEEDSWKRLIIGSVAMRVAKQSGRCVIPTTASSGARNRNFEPTATLRRLRACYHRHQQHLEQKSLCYMFGLDLFHEVSNVVLTAGDPVVPTQTQPVPQYVKN